MDTFVNKNDKQVFFNQIKGVVAEINEHEMYCSITLSVGHEQKRFVNLNIKKIQFDKVKAEFGIDDKVIAKYYVTSKKKNDRWFTSANVLSVEKAN